MATNSERSFADRLGRARSMQTFIDGFIPVFVPQDPNIAAGAFLSYCNGCEAANTDVSAAETDYTNKTGDRVETTADLKALAGRVEDSVTSNVAWKKFHKSVIDASQAVRGTKTPAKKPAPPAGTPPPAPKPARQGAQSQQGFSDIAKHFAKLVKAVEKITGYASAPGSGLSLVDLNAKLAAYVALNSSVQAAEVTLDSAQTTRLGFYNGEGGLKEKMKSIKKATAGQYGRASTQYLSIKSIAL